MKTTLNSCINSGVTAFSAMILAFALSQAAATAQVAATGGDDIFDILEDDIPYRVHVFTNTVPSELIVESGGQVEILVVGGGGGGSTAAGSSRSAGGGGGGGVVFAAQTLSEGTYSVMVGEGGLGQSDRNHPGHMGDPSSFGDIVALGGGGGGGADSDGGLDGGSGGGAGGPSGAKGGAGLQPDSDSGGFGNPGGDQLGPRGSGGGGAMGAGESLPEDTGPGADGGPGYETTIMGESVIVGAGGGGGRRGSDHPGGLGGGIGSASGAGDGGAPHATSAAPNRGGGGGGGGTHHRGTGGDGGAGIVVIRYSVQVMNIDPFTLSHPETGSTAFSNTNRLYLSELIAPEDHDLYQLSESDDPKALGAWHSTNQLPSESEWTFSETLPDSPLTLYAWFKDSDAPTPLLRGRADILYTESVPQIRVHDTLTRETAGFSVRITPEALDDGSTGGTAAETPMAIHAMALTWVDGPYPEATPDAAYVTLTNTGAYTLALTVVNEAGNAATATSTVNLDAAIDLPSDGDRYVSANNFFAEAPYTNWTTAAASIQGAVNAISNPQEKIWVAPGIYTGSGANVVTIDAIPVEGLTIRGLGGAENVVIDAEDARRGMYIETYPEHPINWLINGFSIVNGLASGEGGGVYLRDRGSTTGTVTLDHLVVQNSHGNGGGGGVHLRSDSNPAFQAILRNSVLSGNTAPGRGAGLYLQTILAQVEYCEIVGSVMTESRNALGCGIYVGGTLEGSVIRNTLIADNHGGRGGGMGIASGHLLVENAIVRGNTSSSRSAGVYVDASQTPIFRNVLIYENIADSRAGGIASMDSGGIVLENCTIANNFSEETSRSGGVHIEGNSPGTAYIRNSILYRNYLSNQVEQNLNFASGGNAEIRHSCITAYTPPPDAGNINVSPQFVDFEGGNFRLSPGSPCIQAGEYLPWMDDAVDLDGKPRINPLFNQVDMGVYEFYFAGTTILVR